MPSDLRDLTATDVGRGWVTVHLAGELDLATAPELRDHLADLLGPGDRDVVVDLGGVTFFDTSAFDVLVDARRFGVATGASLFLRAVPEHVRRVLRITGMGRLLPVR